MPLARALTPYRRAFATPGSRAFSATGLLARLPISMMSIGIVLLISATTGSYSQAGLLAAIYIIANAAVAIPHGQLIDRVGQSRMLWLDGIGFALGGTLLVAFGGHADTRSQVIAGIGCAIAGIAIPPVGSMVRARWAAGIDDPQVRHTAFSWEAVVDEIVFVVGPALVTVAASTFTADAALAAAVAIGIIGPWLLAGQRRTEPPRRVVRAATVGALPWRHIGVLTVVAISLGSMFGALEVSAVAFSTDVGHRKWAGLLVSAFASGSLIAGLITGAIHPKTAEPIRIRIGLIALMAVSLLLPWVHALSAAAAVLFLVGLGLAPTLVAIFTLLEAVTPPERLNESMAFLQTGMSGGTAFGAWLTGIIVDHNSGATGYYVCAVSAALAFVAALALRDADRAGSSLPT